MTPVPKSAPFKVSQVFADALALHTHTGAWRRPKSLYSQVLAHRPDHFDALQMLSVVKLAKGQPAEALRLISEAMRLRKPSPQILLNYGMILHALNRIDETLASFDAALKQKSRFAEAHNNRGAALADLWRNEEALECFNKATALKNDYADASYNRARRYASLGDTTRRLRVSIARWRCNQITSRRSIIGALSWKRSIACRKRLKAITRRWRSHPISPNHGTIAGAS